MGRGLFRSARCLIPGSLCLLLAIGMGLQGCASQDHAFATEKDPLPTKLIVKQIEESPPNPPVFEPDLSR